MRNPEMKPELLNDQVAQVWRHLSIRTLKRNPIAIKALNHSRNAG